MRITPRSYSTFVSASALRAKAGSPADVVNTLPLGKIEAGFAAKRQR